MIISQGRVCVGRLRDEVQLFCSLLANTELWKTETDSGSILILKN